MTRLEELDYLRNLENITNKRWDELFDKHRSEVDDRGMFKSIPTATGSFNILYQEQLQREKIKKLREILK